MAETANRSRGSGRRVRGAFAPEARCRVPQPDIIEHFGNADAVPQLPERCLSRKAGIVRCCLNVLYAENPKARCRVDIGLLAFYTERGKIRNSEWDGGKKFVARVEPAVIPHRQGP